MRKRVSKNDKWMRRVIASAMAFTLAVPSTTMFCEQTQEAVAQTAGTEQATDSVMSGALVTYDFEAGTDSLNVEGEQYLKLENGSPVVENGEYAMTQATALPEVINDNIRGKVLEFKDSESVNSYVKTIPDEKEDCPIGSYLQLEEKAGGRVKLENPYKGMTFDESDPDAGVTISYWVKTPVIQVDENGDKVTDGSGTSRGANSTTVVFNNADRTVMNKDDYAKYLACQAYDKAIAERDSETLKDYDMGTQKVVTDEDGNAYVLYENYGKLIRFNPNYPSESAENNAKTAISGNGVVKAGGWYVPDNDSNGKITVTDTEGNTYKICSLTAPGSTTEDQNQYALYATRYAETDDQSGYSSQSIVREGCIKGSLQISTDNDFGFCEDNYRTISKTDNSGSVTMYPVDGAVITNPNVEDYNKYENLRGTNLLFFDGDEKVTNLEDGAGEWHYVTVVIQNDWVSTYVDGVWVDPEEEYYYLKDTPMKQPFCMHNSGKLFNYGKGLRGIYGHNASNVSDWPKNGTAVSSPCNSLAISMLEWIADENTELYLGGTGFASEILGQGYGTIEGVCLDDVTFFDRALDSGEADALYEEVRMPESAPVQVARGDVNKDGMIGMDDVQLTCQTALKIINLPDDSLESADIDQDGKITLSDAMLLFKMVLRITDMSDILSKEYPIKEMDSYPTAQISSRQEDGKLICDINVTNADVHLLDYGISYDSSKLKLTALNWNSEFKQLESMKYFTQLGADFVVLGSVGYDYPYDSYNYSGTIGTLTFDILGSDTGDVKLEPNSANSDTVLESVSNPITADSSSSGGSSGTQTPLPNYSSVDSSLIRDVNQDGVVSLTDAQQVLKGALNVIKLTDEETLSADVNMDGRIDLSDASKIFQAILGINVTGTDNITRQTVDTMPASQVQTEIIDNKLYYTFSVENADLQLLDYGIVYDSDCLSIASANWKFSRPGSSLDMRAVQSKKEGQSYLTLGYMQAAATGYTGAIAQICFNITGDLSEADPILLVPDSSVYKGDFTEAKNKGTTVVTDVTQYAADIENKELKPSISATNIGDRKVRVAVSLSGITDRFDIGVMYDASKMQFVDLDWDDSAMNNHFTVKAFNSMYDYEYVCLGAVSDHVATLSGETLAYLTFELLDGVSEADFSICLDSADYKNTIDTSGVVKPLREVAPALDTCHVKLSDPSQNPGIEDPDVNMTPHISATLLSDRKVQVAISLSGITDRFDIGVMYDASKVQFAGLKWNESVMKSKFAYWTSYDFIDYQYVVIGGTCTNDNSFSGEKLAYITFELLEGVDEADFSICLNSAQYRQAAEDAGITDAFPLRELAPALDTCSVNLTDQSSGTKKEEQITNEDGTVTNKVTETESKADGTKTETITETTTATDGTTTNKVTETVQKPDGTTVTTNKETVTKPDGSVEEEEKIITKDEVGLLISILNKLIQLAENIYERLSTTEKQQIDGSLIVKAVKEVSKLNEAGQVVTQSSVTDTKKDVSGTSVEVYEYDTNILPADVEWNTKVLDKLEESDKKAIEKKGAKDYVTYDINPQSQGVKVEPKDGSVKVSLFCGNKWEGKKIKVFDFEKNVWLDAIQENGYVSFEAEHFSKYAIAEVADVKRGDVNLDGSVTLLDAQGALKAALKIQTLEGDAAAAADVDGDGAITLLDAQMVLKAALIIIEL